MSISNRKKPERLDSSFFDRFSISYSGPALKDDGMDLLDLGSAMVAMGRLLQSANASANGDRAALKLKVYPLEQGSVVVNLGTSVTLTKRSVGLISSVELADSSEVFRMVFGRDGIIDVMRRLRGEAVEMSKPDSRGRVVIRSSDQHLQVSSSVAAMLRDGADRRAAGEIVKPLRRPGIESLRRTEGARTLDLVRKEDLPAFSEPDERDLVSDGSRVSEIETILIPRNQPMYRGPKWRVRFQGISVDFHVTIRDNKWLTKHDSGEIDLRPGNGLRVLLRTDSFTNEQGEPDAVYSVVRVLGVERGLRGHQTSFDSH